MMRVGMDYLVNPYNTPRRAVLPLPHAVDGDIEARTGKWLTQAPGASKWQTWDLNSAHLTLKLIIFCSTMLPPKHTPERHYKGWKEKNAQQPWMRPVTTPLDRSSKGWRRRPQELSFPSHFPLGRRCSLPSAGRSLIPLKLQRRYG